MTDKELEQTTGLTREMIKEYRSMMEEGKHWVREPSKRPQKLWSIKWTQSGLDRLKELTNMKREEDIVVEPLVEKEGMVARNDFPNVRMLLVDLDGKQVNALCRDARMFRMGMKVKVRHDGERWAVCRHPRFPGKY